MTTSTLTPFIRSFFLILAFLLASPRGASWCLAMGPDGDSASFAEAVASFKSGKFDEARKTFLELEEKHPADATLLLNLGLIAQKQKHSGAALALWRKGLASHPTDEALLNAVDWLKPKIKRAEIAHEIEPWEEFRRSLLLRVSPLAIVVLSALFLLASGFLLLRWWGRRKRAFEEESAAPPAPIAGAVLGMLFVFLFSTSLAIFLDRLDIRGTVLTEKIDVRSAPDAAATTLFELFEGMEVVIRDTRRIGEESWRRITYPGGGTGWVRDYDVMTWADPSVRAFPSVDPRKEKSTPSNSNSSASDGDTP